MTIGLGGSPSPASLSLDGGRSSSDLAWVTEQTGPLASSGHVTVNVAKHTQLNGAVLASEQARVNVTAGTLTVTDILDHDIGSSQSGQAGIGVGMQPNGTGQAGSVSGTLSGELANHDKGQITKGAIGAGTLTITDPKHQTQAAGEINRDTTHTREITRDESSGGQGLRVVRCHQGDRFGV